MRGPASGGPAAALEVGQRGIAGAEIVDIVAHAQCANGAQRFDGGFGVSHGCRFSDFQRQGVGSSPLSVKAAAMRWGNVGSLNCTALRLTATLRPDKP